MRFSFSGWFGLRYTESRTLIQRWRMHQPPCHVYGLFICSGCLQCANTESQCALRYAHTLPEGTVYRICTLKTKSCILSLGVGGNKSICCVNVYRKGVIYTEFFLPFMFFQKINY